MALSDVVAMLRRNLIAALAICMIAGVSCLYVMHKNPGYSDTAEVAFTDPPGWGVNSAFNNTYSLLAVEELTGWYMMSTPGQQQVRAAGGTGSYEVSLFNDYNEEYPDYDQPYVAVTAESNDPVAALNTFNIVVAVMKKNLQDRQLAGGASGRAIIQTRFLSIPTGPVKQGGSHKRTIIGFALLMVTALITITGFLDRRRVRFQIRGIPVLARRAAPPRATLGA